MPKTTDAAKEKLATFNAKQTDWFTVCPKCSAKLEGSLADLRAHKCKEPRDGS